MFVCIDKSTRFAPSSRHSRAEIAPSGRADPTQLAPHGAPANLLIPPRPFAFRLMFTLPKTMMRSEHRPPSRRAYMAEAPATSSIISEVIFAWRLRLYSRERDLESSFALSVALDIAFMRAASSEARDSWSARRICEFM